MASPSLRERHWPIPVGGLLALVVVVVLAHMLTLQHVALRMGTPEGIRTRVFSTRSIAMAPPPAADPAPMARPMAQLPSPRPPAAKPVRPPNEGVMAATAPVLEPVAAAASAPMPEPVPVLEPAAEVVTQIAPLPAPVAPEAQQAAAMPAALAPPQAAASAPETTPLQAGITEQASRPFLVPGSIRLNFDATGKRGRFDYKAMGTLTWLQDGSGYDMQLEMGDWIIGKRILSSTGKLGSGGLAPTRFSDKFRSERAAHFDRNQNRITFSANTPPAMLAPGAQDQLSIFAQLASMVAADPLGFAIGSQVQVQTAGPRDASQWLFVVEREEMLSLPGGQVPALKLVRKPRQDYDQTLELWLAPELGYLPARIRITFANGDNLDQKWRSSSPP